MTQLSKKLTRRTTARVSHGYNPQLVVTLYPGGVVELREARSRRPPVALDLGQLYVSARIKEALAKRPKGKRDGR